MDRLCAFILCGAGGLIAPAVAAAEEVPGAVAPDLFSAGMKTTGVLALLIGALLLALYLVRRFGPARAGLFGGPDLIRVIGTKALAPKKYIALVEVGGVVLTLGVTEERITRLDKTPADEFKALIEGRAAKPAGGGFTARLRAAATPTAAVSEEFEA